MNRVTNNLRGIYQNKFGLVKLELVNKVFSNRSKIHLRSRHEIVCKIPFLCTFVYKKTHVEMQVKYRVLRTERFSFFITIINVSVFFLYFF